MKKILIIGGSYFLGRIFVEALSLRDDYDLYVVNRGNNPLNIQKVKEIKCNRNDTAGLTKLLPKLSWDAVIDFCAYTPQDVVSLFSALSLNKTKQYIFISTVSVYADTKDLPINERSPTLSGPQPELGPAADYGYQKALAEKTMSMYCRQNNIPFTCLRPGIIYGQYNYAPRESYFFDLFLRENWVAIPQNDLPLFQFVSVWDVARVIELSIGNQKVFNRTFNINAPELISYGRLIEVLETIIGRTMLKRYLSPIEIDQQRIPLPFPLTNHLIYSGELIQQGLSMKYTSLIEGMQMTYNWYCDK